MNIEWMFLGKRFAIKYIRMDLYRKMTLYSRLRQLQIHTLNQQAYIFLVMLSSFVELNNKCLVYLATFDGKPYDATKTTHFTLSKEEFDKNFYWQCYNSKKGAINNKYLAGCSLQQVDAPCE